MIKKHADYIFYGIMFLVFLAIETYFGVKLQNVLGDSYWWDLWWLEIFAYASVLSLNHLADAVIKNYKERKRE